MLPWEKCILSFGFFLRDEQEATATPLTVNEVVIGAPSAPWGAVQKLRVDYSWRKRSCLCALLSSAAADCYNCTRCQSYYSLRILAIVTHPMHIVDIFPGKITTEGESLHLRNLHLHLHLLLHLRYRVCNVWQWRYFKRTDTNCQHDHLKKVHRTFVHLPSKSLPTAREHNAG